MFTLGCQIIEEISQWESKGRTLTAQERLPDLCAGTDNKCTHNFWAENTHNFTSTLIQSLSER